MDCNHSGTRNTGNACIFSGRSAARAWGGGLAALLGALLMFWPAAARAGQNAPEAIPGFRHVDAALASRTLKPVSSIRFLLSPDFPPFVYRNANGALTGFSVAVAQSLCRDARINCAFAVVRPEELTAALRDGRGDAILYGMRMTTKAFSTLDFTRPYMKALGAFACRKQTPVKAADARALAGKRIGVVKNTIHARWLKENYPHSRIQLMNSFRDAAEALRTAKTDAFFGDWLQMSFWTAGSASRDCCRLLPGWFPARAFAWNDLAIAVKRGDNALRDTLDRYLDNMQKDGRLTAIARRFLPAAGREAGQ